MIYYINVTWEGKTYKKRVLVGWERSIPFYAIYNNKKPKWTFQKLNDVWVDIVSVKPLPPDQQKAITDGLDKLLATTDIVEPTILK